MPNEDKWYISGPLGIGATEPSESLQVDGSIYVQGEGRGLIVDESNGGKRIGFLKYNGREAGIWRVANQDFEIGRRLDVSKLPGSAAPESANMVTDLYIAGSGNVGVGTPEPKATFDVNGSTLLGYETTLTQIGLPSPNFGAPLKSGFYQNGGTKITGDVPDSSHSWTHLITARHSNTGNNHQLQIAASYQENDKLYFRKIAADGASNSTWNEVATRGTNQFVGNQSISSSNTLEFGSDVPTKEVNAGKIGYGTFDSQALCIVGAGTSGADRKITMWAEGGLTIHGGIQTRDVAVDGDARIGGVLSIGGNLKLQKTPGILGRALVHQTRKEERWVVEDTIPPTRVKEARDVPILVVNFGTDWEVVSIQGKVEQPSSKELKDNIRAIPSQTAREIISSLEPVSFIYKNDPSNATCLGFIAEDSPAQVSSSGGKAIVINHIIAALTRVVKDQQQSICKLQAQVNLLTKTPSITELS